MSEKHCANVYIVWTETLCEDGWRAEYYLFIAAKSHSHAKYLYADFGGWAGDYFDKQPEGFRFHSQLVEHNVPYTYGEIQDYEESAGVDLMLSGVLTPMYLCEGWTADDEYDYRRWNGFRKVTP